ncbi:hypothetical protein GWI33_011654 [Rhynchophorus ferrugineus]|uniref:Uncharacterized protein n=1 Tax=Rhynchophorus ferrugineus TaxID=354439 RepID=A0A834IK13_RHYFE|nr:hypothetical protein GWI33_011654 [Rhynchophorus ferrugineus]
MKCLTCGLHKKIFRLVLENPFEVPSSPGTTPARSYVDPLRRSTVCGNSVVRLNITFPKTSRKAVGVE